MPMDRRPGILPLPLLAGAFAAGVGAAADLPAPPPTGWFAAFFPLAALALVAGRRGWRRVALFLLVVAFGLAGALRTGLSPRPGPAAGPCTAALEALGLPGPDESSRAHLRLEARVEEVAFREGGGTAVIQAIAAGSVEAELLRAGMVATDLRARVHLPEGIRPLAGDRMLLEAELDDPQVAGPSGDGFARALGRRGIACTGRIHQGRAAVIAPATGGAAVVERVRRRLLRAMGDRMEAGPASALVLALALGDREAISAEQRERFADSGLAHLVSVSGLHLGLTVLGCFRLIAALLARAPIASRIDPLRLAALITLPLAPIYALLTGADPPVVRAGIAAALLLAATAAGRSPHAATALGVALLALLATDPSALFSASLQLSVAACWGLIALPTALRALVPVARPEPDGPRWRRLLEGILGALITTTAATLATLPFTALHFERTSLASLPANLVAVPVGLVATALCALATAAGLVHEALLGPLLLPAHWVARLLDWLAAHFATWPGARIPLAADHAALAALTLLPLAVRLAARHRWAGTAVAGWALIALLILRLPAPPDGRLHVEFLPVGQGDATLLRLPDGGAILVDAGGDLFGESGSDRALAWLRKRRVHRLDAMVLSHLHPDHAGGIPPILRALEVAELWSSGRELGGRWGKPIAEALEERGIPRRTLAAGDRLQRAGITFEVLGPPDVDGTKDDPLLGENDASLVLRVVHGQVAILLPGDVEEIGEWALLDRAGSLQAQVVKAPHHGSRTSSTPAFVEATRADHVVFSVGHRNPFGFPHPDVAARWEAAGAMLHRTDRGAIHFAIDGNTLELVPEQASLGTTFASRVPRAHRDQ